MKKVSLYVSVIHAHVHSATGAGHLFLGIAELHLSGLGTMSPHTGQQNSLYD